MMRFPPVYGFQWRIYAVVSLIATSLIAFLAPEHIITSLLVRNFVLLFLLQAFFISIYQVILYPKLLSPLRNLPRPSVSRIAQVQLLGLINSKRGVHSSMATSLPSCGNPQDRRRDDGTMRSRIMAYSTIPDFSTRKDFWSPVLKLWPRS